MVLMVSVVLQRCRVRELYCRLLEIRFELECQLVSLWDVVDCDVNMHP